MKMIIQDKELEKYELRHKWEDAVEFCYRSWIDNRYCIDKLLRVISEAWYMLAYGDQEIHENNGKILEGLQAISFIDLTKYYDILLEATEFGLENFKNDARFNCIVGYLMKITPEFFSGNNGYQFTLELGEALLLYVANANLNDSSDMFANAVLKREPIKQSSLEEMFPGNSAVEEYFKSILA